MSFTKSIRSQTLFHALSSACPRTGMPITVSPAAPTGAEEIADGGSMSACFTRAGQTSDDHEKGRYTCGIPAQPPGPAPTGLTAALALAAIETLTRLGRQLPIRLGPASRPGQGRGRLRRRSGP